jgi:hypothetical protein
VRAGTAKLLTLFRPATGEVRAKGVLSAPNAVLHPWLQEQLQTILAQLDQEPLAVRVPLPEDHPLLLTWQHWYWSYERPKPAPALRLIAGLWTISRGTCRTTWSVGCSNAASCPSIRLWEAPGSTWPSRCNASLCAAPCPASIPKALEPRHRLVGANGERLEQAPHAVCLEWQAPPPSRACAPASIRRFRGCCSPWQAICQLIH